MQIEIFLFPQWVAHWFPNEHLYLMVNVCHMGQNILDNFAGWSVSSTNIFFCLSGYRFLQLLFLVKHLTFYHRTLNYHTSHPHKYTPSKFLLRTSISTKLITLGKRFHISTPEARILYFSNYYLKVVKFYMDI